MLSRRRFLSLPGLAVTGAFRDGTRLDTRTLQSSIDRVGQAGGGQVIVPPGRYLTGTLHLRDRVTLWLEPGAVLLGSRRLDDYPVLHDSIASYTSNYTERCLIRAEGVTDCGIGGTGTIDGSGAAFSGEYKVRPYLIRFVSCRGVRVQDVTVRDSAMWCHHFLDCEDVYLDGVRIRSRRERVNNDGFDIDSCRRVRISNCDIDSGDDAIVVKSTTSKPCCDVVVSNCILSTLCSAFKLGTESNGGFDNIVFSNSTIYNTRLAGIALEMADGGALSRVAVSNITMRDTAVPIFVRMNHRARPVREGDPRPGTGSLSKIKMRGIIASASSPNGCSSITGQPGHPVQDVVLEDIDITVPGGAQAFPSNREVPENADAYPEHGMFGALPAHGLYCRHVRNLALRHVKFRPLKPDGRPALVTDDCEMGS